MLLERLEALNFRNLSGSIDFSPGLNVLAGENGQGKTNWLEAVSVLASTRSFRTARLQEAIQFDATSAILAGHVRESAEIVRELRVMVEGSAKTLLVNAKKETAARYLGQLSAVVFSSNELEIVRGQPDARRRFLDTGIVSLHPPFIQVFTDYSRVLRQKNSLLQAAASDETPLEKVAEALGPWNEQLVKLGSKIHRARVRFVQRINEVLENRLFGREELEIRYASSLEGKGDLSDFENLLAERLELRVLAETAVGRSLIGPHRDDLEIKFDGRDIRRFGSAGQQRSALLLLLLANIAVFNATRGEYPLFLLDDIDAELDYQRIGALLEFLEGKTQTIVSTSKESFVQEFGTSAALIRVSAGVPDLRNAASQTSSNFSGGGRP